MRRLTSLFSRQSAPRSSGRVRRSGLEGAVGAAKPRPKRCLNEGGHKLYR
jgi:hypothetical protein